MAGAREGGGIRSSLAPSKGVESIKKNSIAKAWKIITEIGGNCECDCVTYEKMALILGSVSRTLECSAGPKSRNDKMRYTNI